MDIKHTPHAQAADAEVNDALESSCKDAPEEDRRDRRQMRIAEYEDRSLDHPIPLVASIGAANADLLTMVQQIGTGINLALADAGAAVETVRENASVFSTFLNITRQIGRYAQFELRAAEAHQELESLKITLKRNASSGLTSSPPRRLAANRDPRRGAR